MTENTRARPMPTMARTYVHFDPQTGAIAQINSGYGPFEMAGLVCAELPEGTHPHHVPVNSRVDLASLKKQLGRPPLARLATHLDS